MFSLDNGILKAVAEAVFGVTAPQGALHHQSLCGRILGATQAWSTAGLSPRA